MVVVLAIAAITIAASCEPVKKSAPIKDTPPPGESIAYYFVVNGEPREATNFTQSDSPFTGPIFCDDGTIKSGPGSHVAYGVVGQGSQTLNTDGSVTLDIDLPEGESCFGITGFAVIAGAIGDLATSTVGTTAGSDPVAALLAFDVDGDGDFGGEFDSSGNGTGFGDDVLCASDPPSGVVNETTTFRCIPSAPVVPRLVGPGDHTLQDLKDGVADLGGGVTPTTPVAVVVGIVSEVSSVPEV
ncbi:MAG: hypothetical protein ACRDZV_10585, partial [Acidimicrobiia bacterium]